MIAQTRPTWALYGHVFRSTPAYMHILVKMEAASPTMRLRTLRVHLVPAASVAEEVEVAVETQAALVRCALRRKTYIIYPFHFAAAFHLGLADG